MATKKAVNKRKAAMKRRGGKVPNNKLITIAISELRRLLEMFEDIEKASKEKRRKKALRERRRFKKESAQGEKVLKNFTDHLDDHVEDLFSAFTPRKARVRRSAKKKKK